MTEYVESKSGLMVPKTAVGGTVHECLCGFRTRSRQDIEAHVVKCAEENHDHIRNNVSPRRGPSDPANWDVEYETWARGGPNRWDNWFKEHRIDRAQYERDRASR